MGDTRTLVIHPASGTHSQMDEATLKFAGLSHDMIRLSVGIEDIDDIKMISRLVLELQENQDLFLINEI